MSSGVQDGQMADLPASAQVVIIGAGLAGLSAAKHLRDAGIDVVVLEAADSAGGRVRTDRRDGLLLDRGFQQFNPAYPAARLFDIAALDLKPFRAGVIVALGEERYRVGDPRRWPAATLPSVRAPVGSLLQKLRFLQWVIDVGVRPAQAIIDAGDRTVAQELSRRGLSGRSDALSSARSLPASWARTPWDHRPASPTCWFTRLYAGRHRFRRRACKPCPSSWSRNSGPASCA
jgi:phytoene dehydrogenase-like protein